MITVSANLQKKKDKFYIDLNYRPDDGKRIHHSIPTQLSSKRVVELLKSEIIVKYQIIINSHTDLDTKYTKKSINKMLLIYCQEWIENYQNSNVSSQIEFKKYYLLYIDNKDQRNPEEMEQTAKNNYNKVKDYDINYIVSLFKLTTTSHFDNFEKDYQKVKEFKATNKVNTLFNNPNLACNNEYANMKFVEFVNKWLELNRENISKKSKNTFAGYQQNTRKIKLFFLDTNLSLKEITKYHIQNFFSYLKFLGFKNSTIDNYYVTFHKIFKYALQNEYLISNQVELTTIEKPEPFNCIVYNYAELFNLFNLAFDSTLRVEIILTSLYGLRRSEILGLRWSNIDFVKKTLTIQTTVTEAYIDGKCQTIIKDIAKTNGSYATFPLTKIAETILLIKKRQQLINMKKYGNSYNKDYLDYVCVDDFGNLLKPSYVSNHFSLILDKLGLRHIRFHDLRHSCAMFLLRMGRTLKEVQEWLRHQNYSTTDTFYSHWDDTDRRNTAFAVFDVFDQKLCDKLGVENENIQFKDDKTFTQDDYLKLQDQLLEKICSEKLIQEKVA